MVRRDIMKKIFSYFSEMSVARKAMYLFLVLLFMFLLSVSLAPVGKKSEFRHLVEKDTLFISGYNPVYCHPDLLPAVKEKAYKEALLKLATKDSIQLAVNLADSSLCLYINGIRIHRSQIVSFEQDKFLGSMPGMLVAGLFSHPQRITHEYATIVKMPVVERQAPKDTLEAAVNAWKPDTLIQQPAFLLLETEKGIDLFLEQEEDAEIREKWVRFKFHNRHFSRRTIEALRDFVTFGKQDYHPRVTIKIPAKDLRAIYRALPGEAYVALGIK